MNRNLEKGKRFERRMSQLLSKRLGLRFFRNVVNSTFGGHETKEIYGDIDCDDKKFPYTIECKFHKSFSIDALMCGDYGKFVKLWKQTSDQALCANKFPMLIVTSNGTHTYCIFSGGQLIGDRGARRSLVFYIEQLDSPFVVVEIEEALDIIKNWNVIQTKEYE